MHVLAAPDKFRGTATAPQIADAIAAGVSDLGGTTRRFPLADGGEGTVDAFGGPNQWTSVTGPTGRLVHAGWRMSDDGDAVIEMAQASGLLVAGGAANNRPATATTRGTGELIVAATTAGARRIIIGLGGSATTDGGWGAVQVLRSDAVWGGSGRRPELVVCCDVQTRFVDAAAVFGPQKGATATQIAELGARLVEQQRRYRDEFGIDLSTLDGGGAAGGLAGGLAAVGGVLAPGFDVIADSLDLAAAIADADVVVTGEGYLDAESFHGKVVGGVFKTACRHGVPVVAIVGDHDDVPTREGLTIVSLVRSFGRDAALGDTVRCVRTAARGALQVGDAH